MEALRRDFQLPFESEVVNINYKRSAFFDKMFPESAQVVEGRTKLSLLNRNMENTFETKFIKQNDSNSSLESFYTDFYSWPRSFKDLFQPPQKISPENSYFQRISLLKETGALFSFRKMNYGKDQNFTFPLQKKSFKKSKKFFTIGESEVCGPGTDKISHKKSKNPVNIRTPKKILEKENIPDIFIQTPQKGDKTKESPKAFLEPIKLNFEFDANRTIAFQSQNIDIVVQGEQGNINSSLKQFFTSVGYTNNFNQCTYTTTRQDNMIRHVKAKHLKLIAKCGVPQSFSHICIYCDKSFTQLNNLKRHIKSIHYLASEKEFYCPKCLSYKTYRKDSMKRHLQKKHQITNKIYFS